MKYTTPEISWHGRDPIYSVDFQFLKGNVRRLATCGTDRHIRVWKVNEQEGKANVEFLSTLTRHTRTVNVVRFSPDGQVLASGGDDSVVMLWKLNAITSASLFQDEEQENKENWSMFKVLRSHLEDVYDVSWSSCGKFLLSGSVDNSAILWNVKKGTRLGIFPDHKSFVQGVAFDPLSEYLATMSSDRALRIYSFETKNCLHTVSKVSFTGLNNFVEDDKGKEKNKMFHDDTMKSFFRRLCFSPDGLLLLVPSGCIEKGNGDEAEHTSFIFSRNNFSQPIMHLPGPTKATLAARSCPVLFELRKIPRKTKLVVSKSGESNNVDSDSSVNADELKEWQKYETVFCLPYRMVFAIATEDAVLLYDTQQPHPFAYISNIHYHTISDISWAHDAKFLTVSSTDGYCTLISFEDQELGVPYKHQVLRVWSQQEIDAKELERRKEKELGKKTKVKNPEPKPAMEEADHILDNEETKKAVLDKVLPNVESGPCKNEVLHPRRVALTTLISSAAPMDPKCQQNESIQKPRRIGITTLSIYKDSADTDRNEENLHLQLESSHQ